MIIWKINRGEIGKTGIFRKFHSATQVDKEGSDLGAMDAKLLQKIEELTLYMIQIDERSQQLEKENQKLKEQISDKIPPSSKMN